MPETEQTNEHRLSNSLSKWVPLLKTARLCYRLLNKMLISSIGMKVVAADCLAINKSSLGNLFYFMKLLDSLKDVPGDIIECGVSSGSSFTILCLLVEYSGIKRHVWGFDTFEGLPAPDDEDLSSQESLAEKGLYSASPKMVKSTLRAGGVNEYTINNQITLVKGLFSQTLSEYSGHSIALLHVDADLYESYKTVLVELWPKVAVGGIIAFDEYEKPETWPGAKKAVDEYFSHCTDSVKIRHDPTANKYYAVKLR